MNDVLDHMDDDDFNEEELLAGLREVGRFVWDRPQSKACVYPGDGHVVLMTEEFGARTFAIVECDDIAVLCAALKAAEQEARPIADKMQAECLAREAILKAKEGGSHGK